MKPVIRGLALSFCLALILYTVATCGNGPPPPYNEGRLGSPHEPYISSISVPTVVPVSEEQTVRVAFYTHGSWEMESEEVHIDEAARTITIVILIREETGLMMPFSARTVSYNGYGNVERVFRVTFTELGTWTIKCNDMIRSVVVRGEWLGEARPPRIEEAELSPAVIVGKEAELRITLRHESGEWFYRDVEQSLDEEKKALVLAVTEGRAESLLPDESWSEDVKIPIILPSLGRWKVSFPNGDFMIRHVQPEPLPTEYDPGEYSYGNPVSPRNLLTPDEVYAGEPASCTVVLELREPYEGFGGVDICFDAANRAIYGKAWVFYHYSEGAESTAEFREELSLLFPEAGQWFIIFSGGHGDPFIRVVNVLPAEE